jgi:hypothetical protein
MKKKISLMIIIMCILILILNYISFPIQTNNFNNIYLSNQEIISCPQEIKEGFYDIEVINGPVSIELCNLDKGEIFHNYYVRKGAQVFIDDGIGIVKISKSNH